jgi:gliding motility-associated-like protein
MKIKLFNDGYLKLGFCFLVAIFVIFNTYSQNFVNGDLELVTGSQVYIPPTSWQWVPFSDPFCQASSFQQASSDIYDQNGPYASGGGYGYPYSGNTFVGGVYGTAVSQGLFFQEGIMQTVSGFIIDTSYVIGLHQCNIYQSGSIGPIIPMDPSGSWAVLVDDLLIGITEASISTISILDKNLEWEKREFVFKATSNTHTIKFLPIDDDANFALGEYEGIVMGIDSVYLTPYQCNQQLNLGEDLIQCEGDTVTLDATTLNASYLWSDGSNYRKLSVTETGFYTLEATIYNCPVIDSLVLLDTVYIEFVPYPIVDLGEDTLIVCQNKSVVLDAFSDSASYLWQDNTTDPTFTVTQPGHYSVEVLHSICLIKDSINVIYQFCAPEVEMPNVFSPDGDNVNDFFAPIKFEGIQSLKVTILNRWGQVVYESGDLILKWEGKDKMGQEVTNGVYFWKIEYVDEANVFGEKDGVVTLIR